MSSRASDALAWWALAVLSSCSLIGCGSKSDSASSSEGDSIQTTDPPPTQSPPAQRPSQERPSQASRSRSLAGSGSKPASQQPSDDRLPEFPAQSGNSLAADHTPSPPRGSYLSGGPPEFDDRRTGQAGIRKLTGKYLTLYTDLAPRAEVDELVNVFDAAIEPWCDYFHIGRDRLAGWHIVGCLMQEKTRFLATGLLSESAPPFEHGHQQGWQLWCYDKPSDYYRRHLLLHEGVHAFMAHFLGGCGPPWYMEGMAEMLALHEWSGGRLTVGILPPATDQVALWGRIKAIRARAAQGNSMQLHDVFAYGPTAHRDVSTYAFSWAACVFLSRHPRYKQPFAQLQELTRNRQEFQLAVSASFPGNDAELSEDWQVFLTEVDYRFRMAGAIIERRESAPVSAAGSSFSIDPQRGWQSTGIELRGGATYQIRAGGRVTIRPGDPDWVTEVEGITIHYHRARPLGQLLYAVRPKSLDPRARSPLVEGRSLAREAKLVVAHDSVLYVRINEAAGQLEDNEGSFTIDVEPSD